MPGVRAKSFKSALYTLKGLRVKRMQQSYRRERQLKKILQERPKLIPNTNDVRWIGREFKNADFFGIDKSGYIVICEAKVRSTPTKIVQQMEKQWKRFQKMTLGGLAKEIDKYVKNPKKQKFFMKCAKDIKAKSERDGRWLLFKRLRLSGRGIPGVKFITITPTMNERIFRKFLQVQKNAARVRRKARKIKKVSYVLANLFEHRGEDILLLVSLMSWKAK